MFGWFEKKDVVDFYSPKEREIYSYYNGEQVIRVDPATLHRKLAEVGPELKIDLTVANSISKDAGKAEVTAIKKIRGIFDLKPFADGGLTEDETYALFTHFLNFRDKLKKNSSSSPIKPEETLDSSESSSTESQPTESPLACGSTESELPAAEQESSPQACGSPSG